MKIRVRASGFELSAELEKYTEAKAVRLTRGLPHKLRTLAACDILYTLKQRAGKKHHTCQIVLRLDRGELRAEESAQHLYATIDIAVVHIEQQVRDYIERHQAHGLRGKVSRGLKADWQQPDDPQD